LTEKERSYHKIRQTGDRIPGAGAGKGAMREKAKKFAETERAKLIA